MKLHTLWLKAAKRTLTTLVASTCLWSCGDESGSDKSSGSGAVTARENGMTFADDAGLPPCDAEREGFLVYVTATANFRTCTAGQWSAIELKGEKGDKGDAGKDAGDVPAAIALYNKYKHSIFRAELRCKLQTGGPASCSGKDEFTGGTGSAFLCGDKSVCTNAHVVRCPTCYEFNFLKLQAIEGDSSSVNAEGGVDTAAAPFATLISNASIKLHNQKDLARFPIDANPPKAVPLVLSKKPATEAITPLLRILSMSFPLGLEDLYADVGGVNTPAIGHCQESNKFYPCLAASLDFSTSNDTDHGSSGSPLIDLITGEVVGVTTAGTEGENANYTWATDASKLKDIE